MRSIGRRRVERRCHLGPGTKPRQERFHMYHTHHIHDGIPYFFIPDSHLLLVAVNVLKTHHVHEAPGHLGSYLLICVVTKTRTLTQPSNYSAVNFSRCQARSIGIEKVLTTADHIHSMMRHNIFRFASIEKKILT